MNEQKLDFGDVGHIHSIIDSISPKKDRSNLPIIIVRYSVELLCEENGHHEINSLEKH